MYGVAMADWLVHVTECTGHGRKWNCVGSAGSASSASSAGCADKCVGSVDKCVGSVYTLK